MNVRDQLKQQVAIQQTHWRNAVRLHDKAERELDEAKRRVRAAEAATDRARKRLREYDES